MIIENNIEYTKRVVDAQREYLIPMYLFPLRPKLYSRLKSILLKITLIYIYIFFNFLNLYYYIYY